MDYWLIISIKKQIGTLSMIDDELKIWQSGRKELEMSWFLSRRESCTPTIYILDYKIILGNCQGSVRVCSTKEASLMNW